MVASELDGIVLKSTCLIMSRFIDDISQTAYPFIIYYNIPHQQLVCGNDLFINEFKFPKNWHII